MDSPVVLIAVIVVAIVVLGGGAILFLGRRKPGSALEEIGRAATVSGASRGSDTALQAPKPSGPGAAEPTEVARPAIRVDRTRRLFSDLVSGLRSRSKIDDAVWDEIEETLILADVGVPTSARIIAEAKQRCAAAKIDSPAGAVEVVRDVAASLFPSDIAPMQPETGGKSVWMFVGVNGVGKTTSIAKIGSRLVAEGHHVVLAAGDTFRAAAADQLSLWAERLGVEIIRGQDGGDPGSVVFDALAAANARNADVVLIDTAGRLQSNTNLMEELAKLRRIIDRHTPDHVETLLVLDATTGQNGLSQAKHFLEAAQVTGIVLTKLDGSAKGGIVLAIAAETGIPVRFVGVGEQVDDLLPFDPAVFVEAMFDTGNSAAAQTDVPSA